MSDEMILLVILGAIVKIGPMIIGLCCSNKNTRKSGSRNYLGYGSYGSHNSHNSSNHFDNENLGFDSFTASNQSSMNEAMNATNQASMEAADFAMKSTTPFEMGGFDTNALHCSGFDSFGGGFGML